MIYLIVIIGLVLRLMSLNQSFWLDEATEALAVTNYDLRSLLTKYSLGDFHPPLYHAIMYWWTRFVPLNEVLFRLPSVFFGLASIVLTFLIGQKLFNKKIGLLGALLLAVSPLHIYYSQEARMYSLAVFTSLLSIYFWLKAIKENQKLSWFLYFGATLAMLYSDYLPWLILLFQWLYICQFRKRRRLWFNWLIVNFGLLLFLLPLLPLLRRQLIIGKLIVRDSVWGMFIGGINPKEIILTFFKFSLGRWSLPDNSLGRIVFSGLVFPFAAMLIKSFAKHRLKNYSLVVKLLVVPLVGAWLISLYLPIYSYFRVLFLLPVFYLLIVLGTEAIKSPVWQKIIILVIMAITFSSSLLYLFKPSFQRENWRQAVSIVNKARQPAGVIFVSRIIPDGFRYYAGVDTERMVILSTDGNLILSRKQIFVFTYLMLERDKPREEMLHQWLRHNGYKVEEIYNYSGLGFIYQYRQ